MSATVDDQLSGQPLDDRGTGPDSVISHIEKTRHALQPTAVVALAARGEGRDRVVGVLAGVGLLGVWDWGLVALLLALETPLRTAYGASEAMYDVGRTLVLLAAAAGALLSGIAVHGAAARRRASLWAAALASCGLLLAALAPSFPWTVAGLSLFGIGAGGSFAMQVAVVGDALPPLSRWSALTGVRAVAAVAGLVVVLAVQWLPGTWRAHLLAFAAIGLVIMGLVLLLRDPGYGTFDFVHVRRLVNGRAEADADTTERVSLSIGDGLRRTLSSEPVRPVLAGLFSVGTVVVGLFWFSDALLRQEHRIPEGLRMVIVASAAAMAAPALLAVGGRAKAWLNDVPQKHRLWVLAGSAVGSATLVMALLTDHAFVVWSCLALLFALCGAVVAAMLGVAVHAVPAGLRPYAGSLCVAAIFLGGIEGLWLVKGLMLRYDIRIGLLLLVLFVMPLGHLTVAAARRLPREITRLAGDVVEDQQLRVLVQRGQAIPMLACRGIDFSYGNLQVLFDVSFTVAEGEMVALLGTNGAGKSTLLKVISGLGQPSAGTIRLAGEDITFLDPSQRVKRGIVQIPGGQATFPRLSVKDNLRAYGYLLKRDGRQINSRIDRVFEHFPALADRDHQQAGSLSGGEAQMLALGKVFLLQPRVLLIDELSLGLAPKVVADLLGMVRKINEMGTTVVLVEQSVNLALSLVDHAYFMEKGRIRFDGPASELMGRDDLLRSVFLAAGKARG